MKNLVFPDKIIAKSRQDMADIYRKIRKDNPAMARLLYKHEKECVKQLRIFIFGDGNEIRKEND